MRLPRGPLPAACERPDQAVPISQGVTHHLIGLAGNGETIALAGRCHVTSHHIEAVGGHHQPGVTEGLNNIRCLGDEARGDLATIG
jgi:hypothetical protein